MSDGDITVVIEQVTTASIEIVDNAPSIDILSPTAAPKVIEVLKGLKGDNGVGGGSTAPYIIRASQDTVPVATGWTVGDVWLDTIDLPDLLSTRMWDGTDFVPERTAFGATGGVITDVGGYRVHTFIANGVLRFTRTGLIDILVVGGGGGAAGGGGGAGGLVTGTGISVNNDLFSIVVGRGGVGSAATTPGSVAPSGETSSIISSGYTLTAAGGGGGSGAEGDGAAGASGGGAGPSNTARSGGFGTAGQGYKGGDKPGAYGGNPYPGAGGGGAGGPGGDAWGADKSGAGGVGVLDTTSGVSAYYAGGGSGCAYYAGSYDDIPGGNGGGGTSSQTAGGDGTDGLGGGGGGTMSGKVGGRGGSGIVVVRYAL